MAMVLVLGGARSGKTRWAQEAAMAQAAKAGRAPLMIATATALDEEMAERIARHQADRGADWRTVEAPLELAAAVRSLEAQDVAVVDCLTLWLSNLMLADKPVEPAAGELLAACSASAASLFLVSNEVGLGIVPDNPLARRFRDAAGRLHQQIAAQAQQVVFLAAGLPLTLK